MNSKNRIYVSPLNVLSPLTNNAEITYGRVLKNNNELQFSYSHRLPNFNPLMNEVAEFVTVLGLPEIDRGFGIGVEYQMFMKSSPRTYVGLNARYKRDHLKIWEDFFALFKSDTPFKWVENRTTLNVKLGHKFDLGKGFILDLYTGIGVNYFSQEYIGSDKLNKQTKNKFNKDAWALNIPVNIKLAYEF